MRSSGRVILWAKTGFYTTIILYRTGSDFHNLYGKVFAPEFAQSIFLVNDAHQFRVS